MSRLSVIKCCQHQHTNKHYSYQYTHTRYQVNQYLPLTLALSCSQTTGTNTSLSTDTRMWARLTPTYDLPADILPLFPPPATIVRRCAWLTFRVASRQLLSTSRLGWVYRAYFSSFSSNCFGKFVRFLLLKFTRGFDCYLVEYVVSCDRAESETYYMNGH